MDADKIVYNDWLLSYAEKTVMTRRQRIREKTVEETYKECDKAVPYEIRNNWIEGRVELRFKYFDQVNDLQPQQSEMQAIRQEAMKVVQKLKLRAEKEAKKAAKLAALAEKMAAEGAEGAEVAEGAEGE